MKRIRVKVILGDYKFAGITGFKVITVREDFWTISYEERTKRIKRHTGTSKWRSVFNYKEKA